MPDTAQAFRLDFQSPWNKGGETEQVWSVKFHTTGNGMANQAQADAHALALANLILPLVGSETSYVRYLHYPVNSDVNDYQASYTAGTHSGTNAGYTSSEDAAAQQAEVCILFKVPYKINVKGRQSYLFKFIHSVYSSGTARAAANDPCPVAADLVSAWNAPVGELDLVLAGPNGTQPTGAWEVDPRLHTRQLRRGAPTPH